MPRNVRPSFVKVSVEGKQEDIATGPRSRVGEMTIDLFVREKGDVLHFLNIECIPTADKGTVRVIVTEKATGVVVIDRLFEQ